MIGPRPVQGAAFPCLGRQPLHPVGVLCRGKTTRSETLFIERFPGCSQRWIGAAGPGGLRSPPPRAGRRQTTGPAPGTYFVTPGMRLRQPPGCRAHPPGASRQGLPFNRAASALAPWQDATAPPAASPACTSRRHEQPAVHRPPAAPGTAPVRTSARRARAGGPTRTRGWPGTRNPIATSRPPPERTDKPNATRGGNSNHHAGRRRQVTFTSAVLEEPRCAQALWFPGSSRTAPNTREPGRKEASGDAIKSPDQYQRPAASTPAAITPAWNPPRSPRAHARATDAATPGEFRKIPVEWGSAGYRRLGGKVEG